VDKLEELQTLAATISAVETALARLSRLRAEKVRRLERAGYKPVRLYRAAGLSRAGFYRIVATPPDDDDWDVEWGEFAARFEDAMQYAVDAWIQSGEVGDVDDYFPLEQLLPRASRRE